MTGLKTLKDLQDYLGDGLWDVSGQELRQVAREWVKSLNSDSKEQRSIITLAVTAWIKYFFNLEDE